MIDIKQEILKTTEGRWARFKLKHDLTELPAHYALRNIQEFLQNRAKIKTARLFLLPRLSYFPKETEEELGWDVTPITLRDESGEIEAWVRPTALNRNEGEFLYQTVSKMNGGDTLYFPILRNGVQWPYQTQVDERIYLQEFRRFKNPRIKRKGICPLFG